MTVVLAALAEALHSPLMERCFVGSLGYSKCCRLAESAWMKEVLQPMCWEQRDANFESCCYFHYGPKIRGLPYQLEEAEEAEFELPKVGRMRLRQHPQLNLEFWPAGWIFARLVSGIPEAQRLADAFGWSEAAEALSRLPHRRPLRMLDVSCGFGLSTIAAAAKGHNVTATEVSSKLLRIAGRNVLSNGLRGVQFRQWDVLKVPHWRSAQRFDLCLLDLTHFNIFYRQKSLGEDVSGLSPPIGQVLPIVVRHVRQLGGCTLMAFAVVESNGRRVIDERLPEEMGYSNFTAALLAALERLPEESGHIDRRRPMVSPLGWLERVGWTPPIFYHLVLW
ncbi:unnamed protein product [Durusdinium trenchii]|uniref:Methyltransferase domain-containing protein n=2 Tax=Durusdinium trenchii TaxID=1381693 RepID=A0ABP0NK68_9DINO